jgi:hypothetical protein
MVGVWTAPVTAQVMMTFLLATAEPLDLLLRPGLYHEPSSNAAGNGLRLDMEMPAGHAPAGSVY